MLAQNFKSPIDLEISDVEFSSLVTVLGMLERGEIKDRQLDMERFEAPCGTAFCMAGWAHHVSGGRAFPEISEKNHQAFIAHKLRTRLPAELNELLWLNNNGFGRPRASQAAASLRTYLQTGVGAWSRS